MRSLFFFLAVLCLFIVWKVLLRFGKELEGWRHFSRIHRRRQRFQTGEKLVKDPVCGKYLPEGKAIWAHHTPFCSPECKEQWEAKKSTT